MSGPAGAGGSLVDHRTGLLAPPRPGPAVGAWPLLAEVPRFRARLHLPGPPVTVAGADGGGSVDRARAACLGEAVERYAATVPREPARRASPAALVTDGTPHVGPALLGARVEATRAIAWLRATDGRLVPRNAVLGHLSPGAAPPEEGVHPHGSTGLAAGPDARWAAAAAAAEVVERDAVARAWRRIGAVRPGPASVPSGVRRATLPPAAASRSRATGCVVVARWLPGRVDGARVALVGLRHPGRGLLGVGAAYRPDPRAALTKAWTEAVVSLAQAAECVDDEVGPTLAAASGREWRTDRAYAAGGWSRVVDLADHVWLLLDPALQAEVWDRLVRTPAGPETPTGRGAPARDLLEAASGGGGVVEVDLSVPEAPTHVVRRVLAVGHDVVAPAGERPGELPCPLV